jgi:hypothetical protein
MEDPSVNLGKNYGDILNIYYFSMFFSTLAPIVQWIGMI